MKKGYGKDLFGVRAYSTIGISIKKGARQMSATTQNQESIKEGDVLAATYSYSSQHNYYLLVTKRTAKTVTMVRLDREIVTDDGYGQNGTDKPKFDEEGRPVLSRFGHEEYKNKRVKFSEALNQECVKVGEFIGVATKWDGKARYFYTD